MQRSYFLGILILPLSIWITRRWKMSDVTWFRRGLFPSMTILNSSSEGPFLIDKQYVFITKTFKNYWCIPNVKNNKKESIPQVRSQYKDIPEKVSITKSTQLFKFSKIVQCSLMKSTVGGKKKLSANKIWFHTVEGLPTSGPCGSRRSLQAHTGTST